jgi:ABC-type microcin C transport system permease subunit YejE
MVFNFSREKGNLIQTWPSLPTVYILYTMESFTVATMTWLTAMEYLRHKWPRICSTCGKHFFRSFPRSWLITRFVTRLTRRARYAWMGLCLSGRSNHFWLSLISRIPISVSSFGCIIVLFSTIVLLFVLVFNFSKEKGNLIQTWPSLPTVYTVYTMAIRKSCDIIYRIY